jgi:ATP-dependent exoDNAse (exonuclease V) beta subunit
VPVEEAHPPAATAARPGAVATSLRDRARALTDLRARAASEMARPFKAAASADGHAGEREEFAESRVRESSDSSPRFEGAGREAARVAGTVVHRILEDLDLAAEPSEELARQRERVPRLVKGLANVGVRAAAAAQAERILGGLADAGEDGLLGRLRSLREYVVARELDVLLPPEADDAGPVGFLSGAIDLVYRDPEDGRFVVADYKTDAIASEADVDERTRRYQGQGRVYQRALREALDLSYTPRFELWFVSAGIVREL